MTDALNLAALTGNPEQVRMWDLESDFGLAEIAPVLSREFPDRANLRCLEIGCGPGLLLHKLQRRFADFTFEAIEPVGAGFSSTEDSLRRISAALGLTVHRCGYEDFKPSGGFDLIYSINVFEHVADWRHYLSRTFEMLAPGGVAVTACPNHSFPFESHFILPIIINKTITQRLFAGYIRDFERARGCEGLWDALNFVKKSDVAAFLKTQRIPFRFDEGVMDRMFARMFTDPHFQKRLAALRGISRLAHRTRLTRLIELPLIRAFAPFMKLVVSKPG